MKPNRLISGALLTSMVVFASCGSPVRVEPQSASPSETIPLPSTTPPSAEQPSPITLSPTGSSIPKESSVPLESSVRTIQSDLGDVAYRAPAGTVDDVHGRPILPKFVVGYDQWIVTDCCFLKIVMQNLSPPSLKEEIAGSFSSNDLAWTLYDTGPRDGTTMSAQATLGQLTVLVGAQNLFNDRPISPSASEIAEAVARSVSIVQSKGP